MNLSQKCQYAVRAVLELARRYGQGPVAISQIAASQAIPQRFLENILNEIKPTGLIASRRGIQGGYQLAKDPAEVTVGEIIRLIDGPLDPVRCIGDPASQCCPMQDQCTLMNLWQRAKTAVESVYDGTSFRDLVVEEEDLRSSTAIDFSI